MAEKRLKRPRDPVQLGKMIGDILTGQVEDAREEAEKSPAAQELGRKGGKARAAALSKRERRAIAKKGAAARWAKQ